MTNHLIFTGLVIFLCACTNGSDDVNAPGAGGSGPYSAAELTEIVEYTRDKHGLPALGVLIQIGDQEPIVAVSGVRKLGAGAPATASDLWHIGSTAKSMTATLLATYVQEEAVSFETTLYELFPEHANAFTLETKLITLAQILNHTAGLKPNPVETPDEFANLIDDTDSPQEQRKKILLQTVSENPLFAPGSDFSYSNTGYILAGAVIERLGGKDYETLLAERVFDPLGITDFGFGPPGAGGAEIDQPWGHRLSNGNLQPAAPGDAQHHNPALFNSAGNLHISLKDWALYARDHLKGRNGESVLLNQSLTEQLDMPASGESGYALGWGALVEDGAPIMLTHNGSDGNWFADIRLYPFSDITLLMVTNDGREDGEAKAATTGDIRRGFNNRYAPYP